MNGEQMAHLFNFIEREKKCLKRFFATSAKSPDEILSNPNM